MAQNSGAQNGGVQRAGPRTFPGAGEGLIGGPQMPAEPSFNLALLLIQLRRHRAVFVLVTLAVLAVSVVLIERIPLRYTATSAVLIAQQPQSPLDAERSTEGVPIDTDTVDTQVLVLQSRRLADRVATDLDFDHDPEFNGALAPPGLMQKIKAMLGQKQAKLTAAAEHTNVVDSVLAGLKVTRSGLTYVIEVSFTSLSPKKATEVANGIANAYLTDQLETKFEATQQTNAWLNSRLAGLRQKVLAAEAAVAAYRSSHGLMGLTDAQGSTATQLEISNLDNQIATARAEEAKSDAELSTAREEIAGGRQGESLGDALSSAVIQDLRARRAELSGQVAEMASQYGPKYPAMVTAQRQLADIDAEITDELRRITSGLELQAQVAHGETASLEQSLAKANAKLVQAGSAAVGLDELQREADSDSALYQSFLDRFKQTDAQQGTQQSDASILSAAVEPTGPSSPHRTLLMALGFIVALTLATSVVLVVSALDDRVYTPRDIEDVVMASHLASIPLLASVQNRGERRRKRQSPAAYVLAEPLSVFAEAFRKLRTALLYAPSGATVRTIAITSALPDEGKTTTCLCLARVIAMGGVSIVVVDCDLQRRTISDLLGGESPVGLLEVLAGTATLDQALVADEGTGVRFLPAARSSDTPHDLFGGYAIDDLITQLKAKFDIVLFDTSPMLPVSTAQALATKVDVNVVIARWGKSPRRALVIAMRDLASVGAAVAGVVISQVDIRRQASSGNGAYAYYRAYRDSYGTSRG